MTVRICLLSDAIVSIVDTRFRLPTETLESSGVQRGGERGDGPGHPRQGGIQRVKLQKIKCCNWMIFSIANLLIHAALIKFFGICCQH